MKVKMMVAFPIEREMPDELFDKTERTNDCLDWNFFSQYTFKDSEMVTKYLGADSPLKKMLYNGEFEKAIKENGELFKISVLNSNETLIEI